MVDTTTNPHSIKPTIGQAFSIGFGPTDIILEYRKIPANMCVQFANAIQHSSTIVRIGDSGVAVVKNETAIPKIDFSAARAAEQCSANQGSDNTVNRMLFYFDA